MKELENIALYHRVMRRENFEKAAQDLFKLLVDAQKKVPNKPRTLYLDIDGHRNAEGGFDEDMLELQKEFCLGFLFPYFTEIHLPLIDVKNSEEQSNDVPEKLEIWNANNKKDDSLDRLYIENYSNTEFASEEKVYEYLKKVHDFLIKYNSLDRKVQDEEYDPCGWMNRWRDYVNKLINELYTLFLYGNLMSVSAMTRTLIESYVYISVFQKECSAELLDQWYLCSSISRMKKCDEEFQNRMAQSLKKYCELRNVDYDKVYQDYSSKWANENKWLAGVVCDKSEKVTFRKICKYIGKEEIYEDFQYASSYVHSQDISSKLLPFTFYESIYARFAIMMKYILDSVRLFLNDDELETEIQELEKELVLLGEELQ